MGWLSGWRRSKSALRPLPAAPRRPPTAGETADEAYSQQLAKRAKMEVAREAVFLEDLREIARADREDVRKIKEKHLWKEPGSEPAGGGGAGGEDVGDIIVCDDYHAPGSAPPAANGGVGTLAGLLIGAGLVAGGLLVGKALTAAPPVTNVNSREGFVIELVPPKPPNGGP